MWYTEIRAPPAQKKKLFESPPQASPMRQSASASSFGALVSRSRRIRGEVRRNVKIFETLHSEHIAKRRFLMAHPTSLWRLSWRVVLFCALVARIVAELRLARDESACAKDELMPRCLDRERSAGPAAGDFYGGNEDLPALIADLLGGVDAPNLREDILVAMRRRGLRCKCIRCREVGDIGGLNQLGEKHGARDANRGGEGLAETKGAKGRMTKSQRRASRKGGEKARAKNLGRSRAKERGGGRPSPSRNQTSNQ